jgi:hypothetical protein
LFRCTRHEAIDLNDLGIGAEGAPALADVLKENASVAPINRSNQR